MKIVQHINAIKDPATRQAMQSIFDQIKADQAANKAAFDAHTHTGDAGTPLVAAAASTFTQSLE